MEPCLRLNSATRQLCTKVENTSMNSSFSWLFFVLFCLTRKIVEGLRIRLMRFYLLQQRSKKGHGQEIARLPPLCLQHMCPVTKMKITFAQNKSASPPPYQSHILPFLVYLSFTPPVPILVPIHPNFLTQNSVPVCQRFLLKSKIFLWISLIGWMKITGYFNRSCL